MVSQNRPIIFIDFFEPITSLLQMFSKSIKRVAKLQQTQYPKRYTKELKQILTEKIVTKKQEAKELREKYGNVVITESTVDMAFKGMRGIKGLVTETSLLDAEEGIRFR